MAYLEHYGTPRHSGRYPWGSGENPYQRYADFLGNVKKLEQKGMLDNVLLYQQKNTDYSRKQILPFIKEMLG